MSKRSSEERIYFKYLGFVLFLLTPSRRFVLHPLLALFNHQVRVFEGISALKEAYHDIFSANVPELRTYANPENIFKVFPNFLEEHNTPRIMKGMKMFAINPLQKNSLETLKMIPPESLDEFALIPEDKFGFSCDMAIYGNRVAFVSSNEKFAIIIEHKEIADMLTKSFNLSWEEAKRLDKIIRK